MLALRPTVLLVLALVAVPSMTASGSGDLFYHVRVVADAAGARVASSTLTTGTGPAGVDAPGGDSTCYVLVPQNYTCDGKRIPVGDTLTMSLSFNVASASNRVVRWSEVANNTHVFIVQCSVPTVLWAPAAVLPIADCTLSGTPKFQTSARIHVFAQFLPAAGDLAVGEWRGTLSS